MKQGGLIVFVRKECANCEGETGRCLIRDEKCLVLSGKRCSYFEKVVLGKPNYPFRLPDYDYQKIFDDYSEINYSFSARLVSVRKCECGQVLPPRQRLCEKCKEKKRRQSYRNARNSKKTSRATVKVSKLI